MDNTKAVVSDVLFDAAGERRRSRPPHRFRLLLSGAEGDRTPDLMTASHALSQLSYGPGRVAHPATRSSQRRAKPGAFFPFPAVPAAPTGDPPIARAPPVAREFRSERHRIVVDGFEERRRVAEGFEVVFAVLEEILDRKS